MAGSPSQHVSDVEEDFFASLLNLSPFHEGFPKLDLIPQPQNESIPVNQEALQENASHPPVEAQSSHAGGSRVHRRRLSTRNQLNMETMSSLFHLTIEQATKEVGWGSCSFKKRCRELGIKRWPHRKLQSLNFVVNKLQELYDNSNRVDNEMLREAIHVMENIRQELLNNPNLSLGSEAIKYRNIAHRALERERKKNKKIGETSNND